MPSGKSKRGRKKGYILNSLGWRSTTAQGNVLEAKRPCPLDERWEIEIPSTFTQCPWRGKKQIEQ
jgi:hypothetical protein